MRARPCWRRACPSEPAAIVHQDEAWWDTAVGWIHGRRVHMLAELRHICIYTTHIQLLDAVDVSKASEAWNVAVRAADGWEVDACV